MASPTAAVITATGISAPTYADILSYLQTQYRAIYGADVYLGNDSQDGQFLAIIAQAISDANSATIAAYNAFSPTTAQGNGLSSVVKINGIKRESASYSTADLQIVGQAGTTINNGIVMDANSNQWALPATVTIPSAGEVTVTATCMALGAIAAEPNTINQIATPTLGWQTATNPAAAATGAPVESDAALRVRQATSVAIPSLTVLAGMVGAVANLPAVTRYAAFENDTNATDSNGIPPHSISLAVEGGDANAIASAIASKKTPGAGTFGTTTEVVTDSFGIPHNINFFRPTEVPITVAINITTLPGYNSTIATEIQNAVSAYINSLSIGQNVMLSRLYVPANLSGDSDSLAYEITSLEIAGNGGALAASDVAIAFNAVASCTPASITITGG